MNWIPRIIVLAALTSGLAGCPGDGENTTQSWSQADSIKTLFDGVGVTPEGNLAVSFMGQSWSLTYTAGLWQVGNQVAATPIAATPDDPWPETTDTCVCVPAEPVHGCTRQEQIEQCGPVIETVTTESRTFPNVQIGAVAWTVKAVQTIRKDRYLVHPGDRAVRLGFKADLKFELKAVEQAAQRENDAVWTFGVTPRRSVIDCSFTEEELVQLNDEGTINGGGDDLDCHGDYSREVELGYSRTDALPGATRLAAPANEATDEAFRDVGLGGQGPATGAKYLSDTEPEAYTLDGNMLERRNDETLGEVWDLDRVSTYYIKNKSVGGSSDGSFERPLVSAAFPRIPDGLGTFPSVPDGKTWQFSHTVVDQHVRFPILAGICGAEFFVHSSVNGAVNYQTQSCFNGFAQAVDFNGSLSFDARAGAGGYCNIIVASAAAGLAASVSSGVEFSSHLQTLPPALDVSVRAYSDLAFSAYFKTRILFWSWKWNKQLAKANLWERSRNYQVLEKVSGINLCEPGAKDIVDMYIPAISYTLTQGAIVTFPPPIPQGTFVTFKVAMPAYPNATQGLTLRTQDGRAVTPLSITQITPDNGFAAMYEIIVAADSIGFSSTRIRMVRPETVPNTGIQIRHLSNWIDFDHV